MVRPTYSEQICFNISNLQKLKLKEAILALLYFGSFRANLSLRVSIQAVIPKFSGSISESQKVSVSQISTSIVWIRGGAVPEPPEPESEPEPKIFKVWNRIRNRNRGSSTGTEEPEFFRRTTPKFLGFQPKNTEFLRNFLGFQPKIPDFPRNYSDFSVANFRRPPRFFRFPAAGTGIETGTAVPEPELLHLWSKLKFCNKTIYKSKKVQYPEI